MLPVVYLAYAVSLSLDEKTPLGEYLACLAIYTDAIYRHAFDCRGGAGRQSIPPGLEGRGAALAALGVWLAGGDLAFDPCLCTDANGLRAPWRSPGLDQPKASMRLSALETQPLHQRSRAVRAAAATDLRCPAGESHHGPQPAPARHSFGALGW